MLGVGMIVALLPQRVHALTGSLESVGLVASVFALTYLLAQLPFGFLSDRFGPKKFLIIGYFLCSLSGFVFFSMNTANGIFIGRAIQGIGEAPLWALGPAILSVAYPATKGRSIGIYNATIHVGLTLGPLLGLWIAPDGLGQLPFLVFAIFCFTTGITSLVFLKVPVAPRTRIMPSATQFSALFRNRMTNTILVGVLLYGTGYGLFVSVLPVSLMQSHGFDAMQVSLLFVLFYAAISVSQVIVGEVSDRIGRDKFLVWGMGLAAFGIGLFPFILGSWVYIPLGIASVGLGIFCVTSIAEINALVPEAVKGAASSSYYVFWGAGYMFGPLVIGRLGAETLTIGFLALAILFSVQATIFRYFLQNPKPH